MGSVADELSAGVEGGRIRRRELGEYMQGKGFQDSAISRALGLAVKKWGSLSKIELLYDIESNAIEEAYIPCDKAHEGLDDVFGRNSSSKFSFGLSGLYFKGMSEQLDFPVPLSVRVTAKEYSPNCKAKVKVIPFGDEVQVYWQPHDVLTLDLNPGESAKVEVAELVNPEMQQIKHFTEALRSSKRSNSDQAVIDHIEMELEQTYRSAKKHPPACYIRTPDRESGRAGINGAITIYVFVLTFYSANGLDWFPFLLLRKSLMDTEVLPIVGYNSKKASWSGKGLYSGK